ncbi:MAG: hypothetical protein AAF289_11655 [Cyanobacteria bacterium P01_A01_bin.135]
MPRTIAQHHVAVVLVAAITSATTLSVTYHLLRRSQCLTVTPAAHAIPHRDALACTMRL